VAKLPAGQVQWIYRGFVLVLGMVTFWMCRRGPEADVPVSLALQYGLVLLWMVLVSPHLGVYYMVWAFWPVAVMKGVSVRCKVDVGRPDRLNYWVLRLWILGFFLSTVTFLRAVGVHPGLVLLLWLVLIANIIRGRFYVSGAGAAAPKEPTAVD